MLMNGLETGVLGIYGAVYCSSPLFIYLTGCFGLGNLKFSFQLSNSFLIYFSALWFAETGCELLLAINRCLEFIWPNLANAIFKGNFREKNIKTFIYKNFIFK